MIYCPEVFFCLKIIKIYGVMWISYSLTHIFENDIIKHRLTKYSCPTIVKNQMKRSLLGVLEF